VNKPAMQKLSREDFIKEVLADYKVAFYSREASLVGRKEVLTGKAKFGIFGDGKEVAQLAMAKFFNKGDIRSGYYRDQTFMFAKKMSNVQAFFAQLYAHTDQDAEPSSAGRSMNGHFGTRMLDDSGHWIDQTEIYNSSSDISPTGGQMPRLLGLAWASKLYRENSELQDKNNFSNQGNEIAWGTIGNASTSEGHFWEVINAAGVLQVPLLMSVWDDGYGISVPAKYQTTKESISAILAGFETDKNGHGIQIFKVNGWDYPSLCKTYQEAAEICRNQHTPVLIHVTEITQPQGHSTSGSHERYKSKERLDWEQEMDCIVQMRKWILESKIADEITLLEIENKSKEEVVSSKKQAWEAYLKPINEEKGIAAELINNVDKAAFLDISNSLINNKEAGRKDISIAITKVLYQTMQSDSQERAKLLDFQINYTAKIQILYSSHLHSQSSLAALSILPEKAQYNEDSPLLDGREILNACFDAAFKNNKMVIAFGEDLGHIGDVNQGFAGLQEKYGEERITDAGIREASIMGQAIGAAMRGFRPIAEIQYLDYLLYGLQILSDDLATLQWRTKGGQKAPVIIRTRGHRLEGIWHSGSPIGMILGALRGIYILVPRNMTKAAGFYNTMLASDEPALIIECLNGYRSKEKLPLNIDTYKEPIGIPEIMIKGTDVTLVTYGSNCKIAETAILQLDVLGISVELIDVQTLLPFDINHSIVKSVEKTNKLVILDEDVSAGSTAFILEQILVKQQGYKFLDSAPITISAKDHRPAYGTDGDYYSKPNAEKIVETIFNLMKEYDPALHKGNL